MIEGILIVAALIWIPLFIVSMRLFLYAFKFDWPSLEITGADIAFMITFSLLFAPISVVMWSLVADPRTRNMAWKGKMPNPRRERDLRAKMVSTLNRVFRIN